MASAMPVFTISSSSAHVIEGRDLPRLIGLDVGVDQVPHVGLVGLEVEGLAAGLADDLAQLQVMVELLLDAGDVGRAVAGRLQFVGDVGVGPHQGDGGLVERGTLRFPLLQVGRDLGVAAEVMDVLQLALGRLDRLAQQGQGLQRIVQALPALLEAILQQHLRVGPAGAVIQLGGVDRDGVLDLLEQVLVVDDVAEVLVLAVQPVGAADGLEQAVVLHGLVDVEVGAGRRVEAGEQLVHHDQQLHVGRLFDEQVLGPLLVGLGLGHARLGVDVLQQLGVGVVDELLVGLGVGAGFLQGDILRLRVVGGDHRALALEGRLLEQGEILAGLVDAGCHQHGVAALAGQARLDAEVEDDVAHHPIHARPGAEHLLHRAPLASSARPSASRSGPWSWPRTRRRSCPRSRALVDVPRLVDQVQHHPVFHTFAELVGVDVAAEDLQAGLPVLLEQRRAGEADEDRVGHHGLHHAVQLAALGAVALVHKDEDLAHGRAGLGLQLLDEGVEIVHVLAAELVDQRAQQARRGLAELASSGRGRCWCA